MDKIKLILSLDIEKFDSDLQEYLVKSIAYGNCGADALLITDSSANDEEHEHFISILRQIAAASDIDIYVGGYIKKLEDVKKYLYAGAKKVFFTFENETKTDNVIDEAMERFGEDKIALLNNNNVDGIDKLSTVKYDEDTSKIKEIYDKEKPAGIILEGEDCISYENLLQYKMKLKKAGIPFSVFENNMDFADFKVNSEGLIPVVAQDYRTGKVLMLAYMNEESFNITINTGMMTYYSRSRKEIWTKGLTSGNLQFAKKLIIDCDQDTLLAQVHQIGPACHTGNPTCFFDTIASKDYKEKNPVKILEDVYNVIVDRKTNPKEGSYTNYLFDKGIDKMLKKLGEEATEIVIAAKNPDKEEIKYEIADFLYHMMVLMAEKELTWAEILDELANR